MRHQNRFYQDRHMNYEGIRVTMSKIIHDFIMSSTVDW